MMAKKGTAALLLSGIILITSGVSWASEAPKQAPKPAPSEQETVHYSSREGVPGKDPSIDITPVRRENTIVSRAQDKDTYGTDKNDFIIGNKNGGTIHSNAGSNIFYVLKGKGHDIIAAVKKAGERNIIRFEKGVEAAELKVRRTSKDLVLTFGEGVVTIKNWFEKQENKLDRFEFHNGVFWDTLDAERLALGKKLTERRYMIKGNAPRDHEDHDAIVRVITAAEPSLIYFRGPEFARHAVGQTFKLTVYGTLVNGTQVNLSRPQDGTRYFSTDPTVATVDKDGLVTCLKEGNTAILAHNGTRGARLRLTVHK